LLQSTLLVHIKKEKPPPHTPHYTKRVGGERAAGGEGKRNEKNI